VELIHSQQSPAALNRRSIEGLARLGVARNQLANRLNHHNTNQVLALARLRLRPTSRVECPAHSRRLGLAHRRNYLRRSNRDLHAKSVHTPPLGISPLQALTVSIRVVPE
jgi:hypothetical protein